MCEKLEFMYKIDILDFFLSFLHFLYFLHGLKVKITLNHHNFDYGYKEIK